MTRSRANRQTELHGAVAATDSQQRVRAQGRVPPSPPFGKGRLAKVRCVDHRLSCRRRTRAGVDEEAAPLRVVEEGAIDHGLGIFVWHLASDSQIERGKSDMTSRERSTESVFQDSETRLEIVTFSTLDMRTKNDPSAAVSTDETMAMTREPGIAKAVKGH